MSFAHVLIGLFVFTVQFQEYYICAFSDMFANNFFYFVACLFIVQKSLILLRSNISIFHFYEFGVMSKNSSPCPRAGKISLLLFSKCLTVLHFIFKSMIHFELIFVQSFEV